MAGTDKSYIRKSSPKQPTVKTAINSFGQPETYLDRHDIYQEIHYPNQYVMDSEGICQSNTGMNAGYYQPEQYREQNSDGTYKHYVEKTAINSFGQPETYNEFTQSTAGSQGIFHGGSGAPKIKPREFILTAGQSVDDVGECKIVLTDNITEHVRGIDINTHHEDYPYTGDGLLGVWTITGTSIVFVNVDYVTTIRDMISAPVYQMKGVDTYELIQPRPLYIENISADPNWFSRMIGMQNPAFPPAEFYT